MKLKKKELLFFLVILAVAAISWGIIRHLQNQKVYDSISIYVNGETWGPYSLGDDQEIVIDTELGHNVCVIKDGQAYMSEADCPDQKCVLEFPPLGGKNSENPLGMIVCLPHEVMISLIPAESTGEEGAGLDGVAG